jgi:hypothetical protein
MRQLRNPTNCAHSNRKKRSVMKRVLQLTLALLILSCSLPPAFCGQCEIQTGPGWIKAKADQVPLGKVLSQVAEKEKYNIYIDEQLQQVPVTFSFQENLPPEKAIKRMVRPYSYAMVFGSDTEDKSPNILEVWVFRKGHQLNARYVAVTSGEAGQAVSAGAGSASDSSAGLSNSGPSIDGKDLVRRDLYVKENAYGGPVLARRDPKRGPDYRPTSRQMQEARWRYQLDKMRQEKRISDGLLRQARQDLERATSQHRAQRNDEIREYIRNENKNKKK